MCSLIIGIRRLSNLNAVTVRSFGFRTGISFTLPNGANFPAKRHPLTEIKRLSVPIQRSYAKPAGKNKKGVSKVEISESELSVVFDVETLFEQFRRPIDTMKKMVVEQLSLRTTTGSVENLKVNYKEKTLMIRELAEINRANPKYIVLEFTAFPDAITKAMETLRKSPLGLNPAQEGLKIIIPVPKVTREHRETMVKGAKVLLNKCKEGIRDVQNKSIKRIDAHEKLSEENVWRLKAQLIALHDKHIAEAEDIFKTKEKELLSTS